MPTFLNFLLLCFISSTMVTMDASSAFLANAATVHPSAFLSTNRIHPRMSTPMHSSSSSSTTSSRLANSFQDGTIEVMREYESTNDNDDNSQNKKQSSTHSIHYRIHNRMNLSSLKAAPILVLHGGPGVPSDYLYPLKDVIPYRSIIYYDQLGSGRSPGPMDQNAYSIESSLDDLELLIKKLNLRRFHLYGQSFGGILAFEFIKRMSEKYATGDDVLDKNGEENPPFECLSVVLSSSPCNVKQVENHAKELMDGLLQDDDDVSTLAERFRLQNQCRIKEKPQPLIDAYNHAGTVWRGTDVISDWKAEGPRMEDHFKSKRMPSAMIMRGEYDFVSEECIKGWKKTFNHPFVRFKVLDGCSHHGLLENGKEYGEIVNSYFAEYD